MRSRAETQSWQGNAAMDCPTPPSAPSRAAEMLPIVTDMFIQCRNVRSFAASPHRLVSSVPARPSGSSSRRLPRAHRRRLWPPCAAAWSPWLARNPVPPPATLRSGSPDRLPSGARRLPAASPPQPASTAGANHGACGGGCAAGAAAMAAGTRAALRSGPQRPHPRP